MSPAGTTSPSSPHSPGTPQISCCYRSLRCRPCCGLWTPGCEPRSQTEPRLQLKGVATKSPPTPCSVLLLLHLLHLVTVLQEVTLGLQPGHVPQVSQVKLQVRDQGVALHLVGGQRRGVVRHQQSHGGGGTVRAGAGAEAGAG